MAKLLGPSQVGVLRMLAEHGEWHEASRWVWDRPSNTVRILEALVRRGHVIKTMETITGYSGHPLHNRPVYRAKKKS